MFTCTYVYYYVNENGLLEINLFDLMGFFSLATKAATFIQVKHRKKTNITFMIIVWNKILNLFVGALCFSVYKIVYNVYKNVNISALSILRGVATIDIELTSIDINQCDLSKIPKERATFDVFRGTHLCQPSTEVSPFVPMACNWQILPFYIRTVLTKRSKPHLWEFFSPFSPFSGFSFVLSASKGVFFFQTSSS